jgi:hypothetical protein
MSELTLYTTLELLELPPPEWLVQGVLVEHGFAALYGKPGDGKTFIGLDLALSIATGRPWQGRAVKRGPVLYVSAEGGAGISKRVNAWLSHHGVDDADVLWLLQPIALSAGQEDVDALFAAIKDKMRLDEMGAEEGDYLVPSLIVVDTLARCFVGDENQQEDMGNFVRAVDIFRDEFRTAVLAIHHSGRDETRERGSTTFKGALDTLMRLDKSDMNLVLSCEKQKDSEQFKEIDLRLHVVPETDSCCIMPGIPSTYDARAALLLDALKQTGPQAWADLVRGVGLTEKEANYPLRLLLKSEKILRKGKVFIVNEGAI